MATRLDKLSAHGMRRYPWKEWSKGGAWQLVKGEDYDCKDSSMAMQAHIWAKQNGFKVRTRNPRAGIVEIEFERKEI